MATAKKAMCARKTKQGAKCKKTAVGKSAYCATHRKKQPQYLSVDGRLP